MKLLTYTTVLLFLCTRTPAHGSNFRTASTLAEKPLTRRLDVDFVAMEEILPDCSKGHEHCLARERVQRFSPVFDFDGDSCLPACAFSPEPPDYRQNKGLDTEGDTTGHCRDGKDNPPDWFLQHSNTYHRWVKFEPPCWSDAYVLWFHWFELYFEKDQGWAIWNRHKHDVESFVLVFDSCHDEPIYGAPSAHGGYEIKPWAEVPKIGEHPKVVYHLEAGSTHAFRWAMPGEDTAENPTRAWVTPPIVDWNEMPTCIQDRLNLYSYGDAAFKIKDTRLKQALIDFLRIYLPPGVGTNDVEDPVFLSCPGDLNVTTESSGQSGAVVEYALPTAADNCPNFDLQRVEGLESGSFFPLGSTKVAYVVSDLTGNTATCMFRINVGHGDRDQGGSRSRTKGQGRMT